MRESEQYLRTLEYVRASVRDAEVRETVDAYYASIAVLGPNTAFTLASDDLYLQIERDLLRQARAGWLHPDSSRAFRIDSRIVVRRPNCSNCGDRYHEHLGATAKCLFASTLYNDAMPLAVGGPLVP